MRYIAKETRKPLKTIRIQTLMESGERKAKRLIDLAGAFTYNKLMPA